MFGWNHTSALRTADDGLPQSATSRALLALFVTAILAMPFLERVGSAGAAADTTVRLRPDGRPVFLHVGFEGPEVVRVLAPGSAVGLESAKLPGRRALVRVSSAEGSVVRGWVDASDLAAGELERVMPTVEALENE